MMKAKSVIIFVAIIAMSISAAIIIKVISASTPVAVDMNELNKKMTNAVTDESLDKPKQPIGNGTSVTDETSEPNQELFNAAKNGDIGQVQKLVEKGVDVNFIIKGVTVLITATMRGHLDIVKFLVENGADVNAGGTGLKRGSTPLFVASAMGHLDIVQFLVDKGANVNAGAGIGFGFTPLMAASIGGYPDIVEFLVANGADVNAVGNINSTTVLMLASQLGHFDIVKFLVDKGADVNAVTTGDEGGFAALMLASQQGHFDIVKFLVANGADVNAVTTGRLSGHTALTYASRDGHLDVVKFLVDKGADVNAIANEEYFGITAFTALMLASREGRLDVVKFLVDKGADVNTVTTTEDEEAITALMLASRRWHFDIVKFLVESGADTEVADQEGKTARDYAIKSVKAEVSDYIETLLKYNPFTSKSYKSTFTYFTQAEDVTNRNTQLPAVKGLLKKDVNGINNIDNYQQITKDSGTHIEITIDLEFSENKLVFSYGTEPQSEDINDKIPLNKQIFTEDMANTYAYLIFPKEWKLSESFQVLEAIKNSDGSNHSIMACPSENSEFSSLLRNYNALLEGSFWSRESDKSQLEKAVGTISKEDEKGRLEQLQEKYKDYKVYKIPFFTPEGITQDYSNIGRSSTIYFDKSSLTGNGRIFIEIPQITFKRTVSGAAKKAGLEGLVYELDLTEIKGNYKPEYRFVDTTSDLKKKRIDLGGDITMEFVYIPAGEFMMGSPPNEGRRGHDESPQHEVKISKGFWMGVYEVTNGQYQQFVRESNYDGTQESNANYLRHIKDDLRGSGPDYPVCWVSWYNARAFCEWLSVKESKTYRLPTEAQWEYACRAGRTKELDIEDDGLFLKSSGGRASSMRSTHPAGQNKPNSFGLYDMYDNVREWCRDWYGFYSDAAEIDPQGLKSGDERVVRGDYSGSIISYSYTERSSRSPGEPSREIGFRVVCDDSQ